MVERWKNGNGGIERLIVNELASAHVPGNGMGGIGKLDPQRYVRAQ